jgi:putative transposase
MELVTRHWSGKHRKVVSGINVQSLVWSNGVKVVPTDCCLYAKAEDGKTKNEHARAMFATAKARGFEPELTMFDSWYSGLDNLKLLRKQQWSWLCRLKCNRQVAPENTGNVRIDSLAVPDEGKVVHLKGYGMVKVFQTVTPDGDVNYWATSQLDMTLAQFVSYAQQAWTIESYHRAIKQCVGIEKAQVRSSRAQRNHIMLALRAFIRLELNRLRTGVSWYQAKFDIVRAAIHDYLANPWYQPDATA